MLTAAAGAVAPAVSHDTEVGVDVECLDRRAPIERNRISPRANARGWVDARESEDGRSRNAAIAASAIGVPARAFRLSDFEMIERANADSNAQRRCGPHFAIM
jgi:hypothetical protein